ncbi:MAG: cytoplasmic protein [Planctomycetota bacterium]
MATLTQDTARTYESVPDPGFDHFPSRASDITYAGAAVTVDSSGDAGPLVTTDTFAGFAVAKCDNSAGSAGDKDVRVRSKGGIKLPVTGVSDKTNYGSTVYASDDDTFTLTASGALAIGKVGRYITGSTVIVNFEAAAVRSL